MNPRLWLTPLALAACIESGPTSHELSAGARATRDEPSTAPVATSPLAPTSLALPLLATLPVRPLAPHTGYARDQFGPTWADADRNGCDTRNDILRRDLTATIFKPASRQCVVIAGTLADPYTGIRIYFERGGGAQIDVDHVVALSNAWATGAATWPFKKRIALANDPLNLLAADATANRAKGDADAATWLPPDPAYHCAYVARQVAVKARYGLWLTPQERDAIAAVLRRCPEQPAPVGDAPLLAPINPPEPPAPKTSALNHPSTAKPRPIPTPKPTPKPTPTPTTTTDPNYGTCKAAKANKAGPYIRGQDPEYAFYKDRDGDGVVCE